MEIGRVGTATPLGVIVGFARPELGEHRVGAVLNASRRHRRLRGIIGSTCGPVRGDSKHASEIGLNRGPDVDRSRVNLAAMLCNRRWIDGGILGPTLRSKN
jgi:hypothetical protein